MTSISKQPKGETGHCKQQSGFALIIALSLMAFIMLLIISLSTLISVETQSASSNKNARDARFNALLGLNVALSELQKHTGPDARVTAEAGILDTDASTTAVNGVLHPRWTGVWKANENTGERELLTWLVSGNENLSVGNGDFLAAETATLSEGDSVELVGTGTATTETVRAKKVQIDQGHYAYWMSGQQTKVLINIGAPETPQTGPSLPETISSQYKFTHLNLGSDPTESTKIKQTLNIQQVALALNLAEAQAALLRQNFFDLTTLSKGLLTNTRDGGLKVDLTAMLAQSALPQNYDGEPIYKTDSAIESDVYATQSPTWNYLKAYRDIKDDVLADNMLTPQPRTEAHPGLSPVIAMFQLGFSGGITRDSPMLPANRPTLNLFPRLVLYNPYSVTLKGRDYLLVLFGNQVTRQEYGNSLEYYTMPIASLLLNDASDTANFEIAKGFVFGNLWSPYRDMDANNPAGSPRFKIECPDIPPGAAVIFTPTANSTYNQNAFAYGTLTPGDRTTCFSRNARGVLDGTNQTSGFWQIFDPVNRPVIYDAALVEYSDNASEQSAIASDVLLQLTGSSSGIQRILNRRNNPAFRDRVFQLTGRIPFIKDANYVNNQTQPFYYDVYNPYPDPDFFWTAIAFAPTSDSNGIHMRPYANFNPRAKELDPRNIDTPGSSAIPSAYRPQHYFYNAYGGNQEPTLDFYHSNTRVYIGGGYTTSEGGAESFVLYDIPQGSIGLYSLGQLQHMQVSDHFDEPGHAIGNSWASPHIARDAYYAAGKGFTTGSQHSDYYIGNSDYSSVDLSYLLNQALWDRTFFSTITNIGTAGNADAHKPVNPRYQFNGTVAEGSTFTDPDTVAASLHIDGAFNINSVSVNAWMALLSGLHGIKPDENSATALGYPFFRILAPQGNASDTWSGFRDLTGPEADTQIRQLAEAIVEQIKQRGPFTSLAQFVNRRLIRESDDAHGHGLAGALQAAINRTDINDNIKDLNNVKNVTNSNSIQFAHPKHSTGTTADGVSGYLTQADILTAIGPLLTARDDTFIIRSYGDSVNPVTGQIVSRAWCETVVQRLPEYINHADNTPEAAPNELSGINQTLGRRYQIVAFRWLNEDEI